MVLRISSRFVSLDACNDTFEYIRLPDCPAPKIFPVNLCARSLTGDTCQGDSGGGLVGLDKIKRSQPQCCLQEYIWISFIGIMFYTESRASVLAVTPQLLMVNENVVVEAEAFCLFWSRLSPTLSIYVSVTSTSDLWYDSFV